MGLFTLQKISGYGLDLKQPPSTLCDLTDTNQCWTQHKMWWLWRQWWCIASGGPQGWTMLAIFMSPSGLCFFADSKSCGASKAWYIMGRRIIRAIDNNNSKQVFCCDPEMLLSGQPRGAPWGQNVSKVCSLKSLLFYGFRLSLFTAVFCFVGFF